MADEIKKMDFDEFWKLGFVQEANRLFFHPRGLAISINVEEGKAIGFGPIWDYRDDPEGLIFGDDILESPEIATKAANVQAEFDKHLEPRRALLGDSIQRIPNG